MDNCLIVVHNSSNFSKRGFNSTWTENFQMFKLDLEKAEEPEIKLPATAGSSKKQESSRKKEICFCFIDYDKGFDCVDHKKLWKILQEMGIPDHLTCFWEICMQVKKQLLELDMEQWKMKSLSHIWLFVTPWTVAYQSSPSMGFSRPEYWSGLPFPSPGDLPDPGIEPGSPMLEADTLTWNNGLVRNWERSTSRLYIVTLLI